MKRILLAATAALASVAAPAGAAGTGAIGNGIVYTVEAHTKNGSLAAACVFVSDRTPDYGPTTVYGVATSATSIWTTITCTVSKNGTTYVDASNTASGPVVTIDGEREGTIPVAGLTICVYAEAQSSIDARFVTSNCDPA